MPAHPAHDGRFQSPVAERERRLVRCVPRRAEQLGLIPQQDDLRHDGQRRHYQQCGPRRRGPVPRGEVCFPGDHHGQPHGDHTAAVARSHQRRRPAAVRRQPDRALALSVLALSVSVVSASAASAAVDGGAETSPGEPPFASRAGLVVSEVMIVSAPISGRRPLSERSTIPEAVCRERDTTSGAFKGSPTPAVRRRGLALRQAGRGQRPAASPDRTQGITQRSG